MKKIISTITFLLFVFSSCQMQEMDAPYHEGVFTAKFESFSGHTKTSMSVDNELAWCDGDQIAIFQGTATGMKYQIVDSSVGTNQATFTFVGENSGNNDFTSGTVVDANIAVYPYSDDLTFTVGDAGEVCTINNIEIPSVQEYAETSFANGAFPMVAVTSSLSEKNLIFKNIIGVLRLSLKGPYKVMGVEIEGNDGEYLAGRLSVTAYSDNSAPSMMFKDNTSKKIVVDCGDGVQLYEDHATDFYIALPPVRFDKGFKVTIIDSDYQKYSVETQKQNSVFRSSILTMPGVESDQYQHKGVDVYLDEYGINHGPGVEIDGVIWAPVNCGYHETNYPYGKLYQWGRKYGQGYESWFDGNYSDAIYPDESKIIRERVTFDVGNSEENADVFFAVDFTPDTWCIERMLNSWRDARGKTEYDPCPDGWRVPTYLELESLSENDKYVGTNKSGQKGVYFADKQGISYVFFPLAGRRSAIGSNSDRGIKGYYWMSTSPGFINGWGVYNFEMYSSGHTFWSVGGDNSAEGRSIRCVKDNEEIGDDEVLTLNINDSNLCLLPGTSYNLDVDVYPSEISDNAFEWMSDDESVAVVDQYGKITAISDGVTSVYVMPVGGISISSDHRDRIEVRVKSVTREAIDYIENGRNYGKGIVIGDVVWAPFDLGTYQWGRSTKTFTKIYHSPYDWSSPPNDKLWNKGNSIEPKKAKDDPCPEGWRVPTYQELAKLFSNHSSVDEFLRGNEYFSGEYTFTEGCPRIKLNTHSYYQRYDGGHIYDYSDEYRWKYAGCYWSSAPNDSESVCMYFDTNGSFHHGSGARANAFIVRCVQE